VHALVKAQFRCRVLAGLALSLAHAVTFDNRLQEGKGCLGHLKSQFKEVRCLLLGKEQRLVNEALLLLGVLRRR